MWCALNVGVWRRRLVAHCETIEWVRFWVGAKKVFSDWGENLLKIALPEFWNRSKRKKCKKWRCDRVAHCGKQRCASALRTAAWCERESNERSVEIWYFLNTKPARSWRFIPRGFKDLRNDRNRAQNGSSSRDGVVVVCFSGKFCSGIIQSTVGNWRTYCSNGEHPSRGVVINFIQCRTANWEIESLHKVGYNVVIGAVGFFFFWWHSTECRKSVE